MKLSECLELSDTQKKEIKERLTKLVSEKSPKLIVENLLNMIVSIVWTRHVEVQYSADANFLKRAKFNGDSYSLILSTISLYLLDDFSKQKFEDVIPDNDQSETLNYIDRQLNYLSEKEKENGSNI